MLLPEVLVAVTIALVVLVGAGVFLMLNIAIAVCRIADAFEAQNRHFGIQKPGDLTVFEAIAPKHNEEDG